MNNSALTKAAIFFFAISFAFSCSDYMYVDEVAFLGTWQLKGRKMYEGMQLQIVKENQQLKGYITSIPSNKYAPLFLDSGNVWVLNIERTSNFAFKIKEQKIASELFSIYGLETTSSFYATLSEDKNRINLFPNSQDRIRDSDIYYERTPSP